MDHHHIGSVIDMSDSEVIKVTIHEEVQTPSFDSASAQSVHGPNGNTQHVLRTGLIHDGVPQDFLASDVNSTGDAQRVHNSGISPKIQAPSIRDDPTDKSSRIHGETLSQAAPERKTVAIRLNKTEDSAKNINAVDMAKLQKAGLVVTTSGLQWKKPEITVQPLAKEEEEDDKLIEEIAGTLVAANEMIQASALKDKPEPAQNDVPIENNLDDVAINTIVVSNDDQGELKMTFTDSAVGRFETIDEKNGVSKGSGVDETDDEKYLGVNLCGFTALDGSKKSRSRKSVKPSRFSESENGYTTEMTISPSKKRKTDTEGEQSQEDNTKKGKKKKKGDSKKDKLSVDDVYNSGESDGDDLSKDVLKVRMCKCDICGKHFLDKDKLEEHKVVKHGVKKKKRPRNVNLNKDYPCEVCGYIFHRREHWRRHKIIHSKDTPYKCELCGRGFKRPEHVRRHQTVHTGDKPYKCNMCSKKFTRNEHLQKHIEIHLGRNPYLNKKKKSKKSGNLKIAKLESIADVEFSSDTSSVTDSPRKPVVRPRLTVIDY